jgi:quercetin dioxygenase-like cupin family protein
MNIRSFIGVACAAVAIATAMPAAAQDRGETITLHFEQAMPNIPGKSLVAQFVDYAPGGASLSHTHAKSAFIFAYIVSGEIESQVNDGPKRVYRAGESWYETPGSIHRVSGGDLRVVGSLDRYSTATVTSHGSNRMEDKA